MLAVLSLICFFAGGILGLGCGSRRPGRPALLAGGAADSDPGYVGDPLAGGGLAPDIDRRASGSPRSGRRPLGHVHLLRGHAGRRSAGTGALEAWAVSPNSGFWVVPAATAFAGATGAMIAVLANVITSAWSAVCVHLMRRDRADPPTSGHLVGDQSPILASFAGLILLAIEPAPVWSSDVLTLAGPLLAFSGAALFTGSMLHPHNVGVVRTEHALRRWTWLTGVRVAYYLALVGIAALASSTALAVVAVLSGLSAPSFQPVQQAVLYGYRSEVVMTAIRWGWLLVPAGLGLALLVR